MGQKLPYLYSLEQMTEVSQCYHSIYLLPSSIVGMILPNTELPFRLEGEV
jgi:hypothetical protein